MSFKSLFVVGLFLIASQSASAYLMAKLGNEVNPRVQHIIVTGDGNELGTMFLDAAIGRAIKINESEPDSLVVIFANISTSLERESGVIERSPLRLERANNKNFGLEYLVEYTGLGVKVASLHFLTHSAVSYGLHLYKGGRYSVNNPYWAKLKGKFTESGYIFFAGCNTGFYLAPQIAEILSVPAAGALTSTEFQYLDERGVWKYAAPITKLQGPAVASNSNSYEVAQSCRNGACIRMMPLFRSYSGYWGSYENGSFPAFKFFCGQRKNEDCYKVMVSSLFHLPLERVIKRSSPKEQIKAAIRSYLCPSFTNDEKHLECVRKLEQITEDSPTSFYSPALDDTLRCSQNRCEFKFECKKEGFFVRETKCKLAKSSYDSSSFVDEYKRYLLGLK